MKEKEEKDPVSELVGLAMLILVASPFSAYVFQTGWNWFVAPIVNVAIGFWMAFGLGSLIKFATASVNGPSDDKSAITKFLNVIIYNAIALLIMWIAHNNL